MQNVEKIPDEDLIANILLGDTGSVGELYNRYYKKVFSKCISIVKDHDEAFDLAQDVLLKAFDNLKKFRGESSFSTWLYTISHRHCLETLRKKNKVAVHEHIWAEDTIYIAKTKEEQLIKGEIDGIMVSLIDGLPQDERGLLLLKYSKGMSIELLRNLFNISSSAVKMRLKRLKEKLNHQLYAVYPHYDH